MIAIIVFVLFGYSYGQFPDSEYCSIPCEKGQHTMCAYPPISNHCLHIESLMNPQRRQKILSLHNLFRNAVAGGTHPSYKTTNAQSSNMRQLYWDLELEGIAERWATQCNVSSNDDCRDVARFSVGQVMSKSSVLTHSLDYYDTLFNVVWFAEVDNLSRKSLMKYNKHKNIKHVAQILNANTMRIGCADVITRRLHGLTAVRATICNYGPAIVNGEEIYKIGHPCANCPVGTKCRGPFSKYPHLCSEFRQFDIAEKKPDSIKVQMDYVVEDPPVFPTVGRKAQNAKTKQGQHRLRHNEENLESTQGRYASSDDRQRKTADRRSHFDTNKMKLSNKNRQPDYQGAGNVGQDDPRRTSREGMYPKSVHPGSDDENGDYSQERAENSGRHQEDDYEQSGGESQADQSWLGGRGLNAERGLNNQTTSSAPNPDTLNKIANSATGGQSPCIRPSHWHLTMLFSTVMLLSLTTERTV